MWRARLLGYEEAAKLFRRIDDEKSSEYQKYLGMMKKFVVETNAMAQEKALDAVLAFVESASIAGRCVWVDLCMYMCVWGVVYMCARVCVCVCVFVVWWLYVCVCLSVKVTVNFTPL